MENSFVFTGKIISSDFIAVKSQATTIIGTVLENAANPGTLQK